jgi:hypothetical protein
MYVMLTNSGTVGASATMVTITWKNATSAFYPVGPCPMGPDGTSADVTYISFGSTNWLSVAAQAGQPFTGTVVLSDGSLIRFGGVFQ